MSVGALPPEPQEVGQFSHRLSFLYAEHCVVHRADNAVTFTDQHGVTHAPAAVLGSLLLGPGTRITHGAMTLLGVCGVSVVWVGEQGVRYYAHGRSLSSSSTFAEQQAKLVTNTRSRLRVARAMYRMRFGDEDTSQITMSELRGREGARMRKRYREESKRTGVPWTRRSYNPEDFESGDAINQALTAASAALYGVAHAAIVALGCIPSLGFIHNGTDRAFVFDIADLYKADVGITTAFEVVASESTDVPGDTRRAIRDRIKSDRLLQRIPRDIRELLEVNEPDVDNLEAELFLWSNLETVPAGTNYSGGD